jgi:transposase
VNIPRMSRTERRLLIRLGRRSGDPHTALRFHAVARLATGRSSPKVASELDVATSTVVEAAHRFLSDGVAGLYDRRRSNGKRKTDDRFDRVLMRVLGRSPEDFGWRRPTWTRELLCRQMHQEGFPLVAVCTMGRALARIGARLGSPKPIVLCPWPRDRRVRVLAAIRRLEARASADEPVLYCDEVDIHLNPKIGRDWMLRGQQRRIVTPGKNEKFYLAGALDVRIGRLHTTGAPGKNASLFCQLLCGRLRRDPPSRVGASRGRQVPALSQGSAQARCAAATVACQLFGAESDASRIPKRRRGASWSRRRWSTKSRLPTWRMAMAVWPTTLRIEDEELKLLVTSPQGDDLLKARLPNRPPHPRALLTLLKGVALWSGEPLYAVISAGEDCDDWLGCEAWGEELWPAESALVHFDFAIPPPRARRTLRGVGDFRAVRRQLRLVWSK